MAKSRSRRPLGLHSRTLRELAHDPANLLAADALRQPAHVPDGHDLARPSVGDRLESVRSALVMIVAAQRDDSNGDGLRAGELRDAVLETALHALSDVSALQDLPAAALELEAPASIDVG